MNWEARAAHQHVLELCRAERADHAAALPFLVRSVRLGHRRSVYALGNWYQYGIGGLSCDLQRAIRYYRVAARGLDIFALNDMAMCHIEGVGRRRSPRLGLFYGLLCAMRGSDSGRNMVREMLAEPDVVCDVADFRQLWWRAQATHDHLKRHTDLYWSALDMLEWPEVG